MREPAAELISLDFFAIFLAWVHTTCVVLTAICYLWQVNNNNSTNTILVSLKKYILLLVIRDQSISREILFWIYFQIDQMKRDETEVEFNIEQKLYEF